MDSWRDEWTANPGFWTVWDNQHFLELIASFFLWLKLGFHWPIVPICSAYVCHVCKRETCSSLCIPFWLCSLLPVLASFNQKKIANTTHQSSYDPQLGPRGDLCVFKGHLHPCVTFPSDSLHAVPPRRSMDSICLQWPCQLSCSLSRPLGASH